MATYYVDSINGLNTNDGLTPATAFADFYADLGATSTAVDTYWVRNTSQFVLTASTALQFKNIISWPTAGGKYHDSRLVDTSTAAWDLDDNSGFIDIAASSFTFKVDENIISFSNFNFSSTNALDASPSIYTTGGTISFFNCQFASLRTGTYRGSFFRYEQPTVGTLSFVFEDCDFDLLTPLVGKYETHLVSVTRSISMTRCTGSMRNMFGSYTTTVNQYNGSTNLSVIDTNIVFSDSVVQMSYAGTYNQTGHKFNFFLRNFTATATSILSYMTTSSTYGMPRIDVDVDRCDFSCTGILFDYYCPNYTSSANYYGYVEKFSILNSNISCTNMLRTVRGNNWTRIDTPIIVENNTLDISMVYNTASVQVFERLMFRGNKVLACSAGLISMTGVTASERSFIDIDDATIGGNLIDGLHKADVSLRGCIVNGNLATSSVYGEYMDIRDSDIDGTEGFGEYEIVRSRVVQNGITSAIPYASKAVLRNSEITSLGEPLGSLGAKVLVIDSILSNDMSIPVKGDVSVFNTELNGTAVAYEARHRNTLKKLSPVFRLGGSPGSVSISTGLVDELSVTSDEVRGVVNAGSASVKAFFASNRELDLTADSVRAKLYFTTNTGSVGNVDMTLGVDSTSQWDGMLLTHFMYSLDGILIPATTDYTQKMYVRIMFNSPSGLVKDLYLDLNLVGV